MKTQRGFTLAEMLAVVGIMLVLMVAAFGVFSTFAQRAGPDVAVSTVQAMLNGARDYAAANGVVTSVYFKGDLASATVTTGMQASETGTTMRLRYYNIVSNTWEDVRGRNPVSLGPNMYVCKDLPNNYSAFSGVKDATSESDVTDWKRQEEALLGPGGSITTQATTSGNLEFYVAFDPAGYLTGATNLTTGGSVTYARNGLTVVQLFQVVSGGQQRTVAYAMYPFNSMSGTRLIFDF
ncbi:MAG: type II secretion system protein [Planctomycetota bacterium]|nr:type II secretion system protein [Planctomycetota bacterium]